MLAAELHNMRLAAHRFLVVGAPPEPRLRAALLDLIALVQADIKMRLVDPLRRKGLVDVVVAVTRGLQADEVQPTGAGRRPPRARESCASLLLLLLLIEDGATWPPEEVLRWVREVLACGSYPPTGDDALDRNFGLKIIGNDVRSHQSERELTWTEPAGVESLPHLFAKRNEVLEPSADGWPPDDFDQLPDPNSPDDDDPDDSQAPDDFEEPEDPDEDGGSGNGGSPRPAPTRPPSGSGGTTFDDLAARAAQALRRVDLMAYVGRGREDLIRVRRAVDALLNDETFDLETFFEREFGDRSRQGRSRARRRFMAAAPKFGDLAEPRDEEAPDSRPPCRKVNP